MASPVRTCSPVASATATSPTVEGTSTGCRFRKRIADELVEIAQQSHQIPSATNIDSVLATDPVHRPETYCMEEDSRPKRRGRPPKGESQSTASSQHSITREYNTRSKKKLQK